MLIVVGNEFNGRDRSRGGNVNTDKSHRGPQGEIIHGDIKNGFL